MSTTGVSGMVNPAVFGIAVALAQYQHCPEGLVMIHHLPPPSEEFARGKTPNGGRSTDRPIRPRAHKLYHAPNGPPKGFPKRLTSGDG